jgi:hypothetical protein
VDPPLVALFWVAVLVVGACEADRVALAAELDDPEAAIDEAAELDEAADELMVVELDETVELTPVDCEAVPEAVPEAMGS